MSDTSFGLPVEAISKINSVFAQYPGVETVIIYGSRAKGTQRPSSDIDLTVKGKLNLTDLYKIENQLHDLLLPYKIDLSIWSQINNAALIEHISRIGQTFFQAQRR